MSAERGHPQEATVERGRSPETTVERGRSPDAPADRVIAAIAARQRGVVAARQLRDAGVGRGSVAHRVRTGRLHRLHPGVYAVGHPGLAPLAREVAALLACGSGAVLSHRSAAELWGIRAAVAGDDVDVTVAGRNPGLRQGVRVHRPRRLESHELRRRGGLPLTSPARTLLDLAECLSPADLERAVAEAQVRRLVVEPELRHVAARHPRRRGAARLRKVLDRAGGPALTESEAEIALLELLRAARLPAPVTGRRIAGWPVDFLWPAQRLAVEVDGFAFHSSRRAFERDRRRDLRLAADGIRVIRVSWRQIQAEPEALIAGLAQALARPP